MLPSNWADLVDDKRLNLLEERLMGRSPKKAAVLPSSPLSMDMMQSPVKAMESDPTNPINNTDHSNKLVKDSSSVSTLLDMQPSNHSAHTQSTLPLPLPQPQSELQVQAMEVPLNVVPEKGVNKELADPEVIVVDETNSQHSRSNHEIRKANAFDLLSGAKRLRMDEDSHSQLTHDSMEGSMDRPSARPKQGGNDDGDNNSPYPQQGGKTIKLQLGQ